MGGAACLACALAAVWLPACSGSGSGSSPGQPDSGAPPKDAAVDKAVKNCVPPGTKSNSKGVGGYCTKPSDCPKIPHGTLGFCTATFTTITPPGEDFCTRLCDATLDASSEEQCGTGAICVMTSMGSACVPLPCNIDAGF